MERESARRSLLGHGLYLAPEPMVLTTVLHSLIPNRNNTEKSLIWFLGREKPSPEFQLFWGDASSQTMNVMGERESDGNWSFSPAPIR